MNEISKILGITPVEVLGFDDKQVFNIHHSTGNNGLNYINLPEKLIEQYEETIQSLKNQIRVYEMLLEK